MWGHRLHKLCHNPHCGLLVRLTSLGFLQGIGEFVKLGDGLVEGETFNAFGHIVNRTVCGFGKD